MLVDLPPRVWSQAPLDKVCCWVWQGGLSIGPFELDLGVEGEVAQAVGSCNTTVTVQGGQVTVAWEYQESENSSSMVYSIAVPFPYKARLWYSGMVNNSLGPRYATKTWQSGKLLHAHEAGSQASFVVSLPTGVTRTRIACTPREELEMI